MGDAVVLLQKLAKNEEIFRIEALVAQVQQGYVVHLDRIQLHQAAVDGQEVGPLLI